MTEDMEKYYSLKEWKKIDIPALREKFLPVVQKAQEVHKAADEIEFVYYRKTFPVKAVE